MMINPVIDAIKQRRSIRGFSEKPVDREILDQIILAGRYAPSVTDDQPWRFIGITNQKKINELSHEVQNAIKSILRKRFVLQFFYRQLRNKETLIFLYGTAFAPDDVIFFGAPALILITTKKRQFYDESCACCAQNMMLAAHSFGIGSCWIGFTSFLNYRKKVLEELHLPKEYHISSSLIFGYPKEHSPQVPLRKPMSDVINWID
jgi:nitroreductase